MSLSTTGPADGGFYKAATPIPHGGRAKRILREHPEVRRLIGRNVVTFWITAGIVAFQVAVAWLLRGSPWWMIVATGILIGSLADHALWVIIHECTHNLIFRSPAANTLTGMLANFPIVVPGGSPRHLYSAVTDPYRVTSRPEWPQRHRWSPIVGRPRIPSGSRPESGRKPACERWPGAVGNAPVPVFSRWKASAERGRPVTRRHRAPHAHTADT